MNPIDTTKNIDPKLQQIADAINVAVKNLGFETVTINLGMDVNTKQPFVEAKIIAPITTTRTQ